MEEAPPLSIWEIVTVGFTSSVAQALRPYPQSDQADPQRELYL